MTSLVSELANLRGEFQRRSGERLQSMRQALDALEKNPSSHDLAEELHRGFHFFAGLGTTYGNPRATELGSEGEALLSPLLSVSTIPPRDLASCRWLLAQLNACFRAA